MVVSMAHYRLYLDESETRNASGSSFFVVGGVILNASSEVAVAQELNALKLSLWQEINRQRPIFYTKKKLQKQTSPAVQMIHVILYSEQMER